jgi:phage FluMu gp28-like protein
MTDRLRQELPSTADSELPAVLMPYQQAWLADTAQLKVVEKSRRTGLTWAEAADDVLTAAKRRRDGGQNVYYIGYNMDMAIEYIEACAMWARTFSQVAGEVERGEELFGEGEDEKHIKTYTIRFPQSGFRIVALSSRPANLRGKQGVVVIDEAAFHQDLDELLKAALALLIWGGRVRVISTHNGDENPFNQLVNEIRAGRRSGSVHRIEFREAVEQGLYQRVCLRLGKPWTAAEQAAWVQGIYKFYGDAAHEELDVIPSQGSGAWLSAALIEARTHDAPVLRYSCPDGFERWPEAERRAQVQDWLDIEMAPLLAQLDPAAPSVYGQDFGRSGDLTVGVPAQIQPDLTRRVPFVVELRNMPHRQQHQVVDFLFRHLPRFQKAALDARGNGHALAEALAQDHGWEVVELVMLSETWYREQMPPLKAAFEDATILLPKDRDIVSDLRAIRMVRGVARVPDAKSTGSDGGQRHGDAGIAVALMHYASRQPWDRIDYYRVQPGRADLEDDDRERAVRITAGWRTMKGVF